MNIGCAACARFLCVRVFVILGVNFRSDVTSKSGKKSFGFVLPLDFSLFLSADALFMRSGMRSRIRRRRRDRKARK